jgi:kynurenine formamidase
VRQFLDTTGVQLRAGDALHLRFGRTAPNRSDVALGAAPTPGLSIECAEWIAEREPSVIITDEGLDPFPSEIEGIPVPWHVLVLTSLGIPLIDRAALTDLSVACAEAGRWEFLSVIAPLPIPGASGSPVNPLAIL